MAQITSVPTPTQTGRDQTPADTTTDTDSGTTNIPTSDPQTTPFTETGTDQTPADTTTGTSTGTTNGTSPDTPTLDPQTTHSREIPAQTGTDQTPADTTKTPSSTVSPEPVETSTSNVPKLDNAVKQVYLDVINDARSESHTCGKYGVKPAVPALKWNDALYKASWQHSNDLAQTNTFSHAGSGKDTDITAQAKHPGKGSTPGERIVHNGYANWRAYGENIAAGTVMDEAQEAIEGWLKSPGHCVNLMSPNFKEVGMAHVLKSDSHYTYYWTQDFGAK
jgi:uncharacterized protein YkwD